MAKSILESHKTLDCKCCEPVTVFDQIGVKPREDIELDGRRKQAFEEAQGVEQIPASRENMAILMELMMYAGRDVNLVDLFRMFKTIHEKAGFDEKCPSKEWFATQIREEFNEAMRALKYMGFVSATRQSTFLFKKNIFGKPKYYSTTIK